MYASSAISSLERLQQHSATQSIAHTHGLFGSLKSKGNGEAVGRIHVEVSSIKGVAVAISHPPKCFPLLWPIIYAALHTPLLYILAFRLLSSYHPVSTYCVYEIATSFPSATEYICRRTRQMKRQERALFFLIIMLSSFLNGNRVQDMLLLMKWTQGDSQAAAALNHSVTSILHYIDWV